MRPTDRWQNASPAKVLAMFFMSIIVLVATVHHGYFHWWYVHFDVATLQKATKAELAHLSLSERPVIRPDILEGDDLVTIGLTFLAAVAALMIFLYIWRWAESQLIWRDKESQKSARRFHLIFTIIEALVLGITLGFMIEDPDIYFPYSLPDWFIVMIVWMGHSSLVYTSDFNHHRLDPKYDEHPLKTRNKTRYE